jgi:hypothetical protein
MNLNCNFLVATSHRAACATDTSYVGDPDSSARSDELHCEGTETHQPNSEWYLCHFSSVVRKTII